MKTIVSIFILLIMSEQAASQDSYASPKAMPDAVVKIANGIAIKELGNQFKNFKLNRVTFNFNAPGEWEVSYRCT